MIFIAYYKVCSKITFAIENVLTWPFFSNMNVYICRQTWQKCLWKFKKIVKYGRSQTDYNAPTLADKVVKQPGKYTAPGNDELAAEIIQTVADSGV